jgi:hypothetical protein
LVKDDVNGEQGRLSASIENNLDVVNLDSFRVEDVNNLLPVGEHSNNILSAL